ncbi:hypothetical protein CEY16_11745 [Halalkalibacillus sediminis]|uniref:Uncharacterized protein n=1 Tax=Halalkalibacillus sediminis TaxID=2018042 RepID=A0A2I0QSV0_9BACI|nr:hypothetical protein CEY16_11745 [Halalkalibacillus sediminis]
MGPPILSFSINRRWPSPQTFPSAILLYLPREKDILESFALTAWRLNQKKRQLAYTTVSFRVKYRNLSY